MNTPLTLPPSGWDQLSLDELVARAPLLDRQENKYVANGAFDAATTDELRADFDLLAIDGTAVFTYETTYFDTGSLLTYRQHAQGKRCRLKIRARRYLDNGTCFFEVKMKGRRGRTIKERMPYVHDPDGRIRPEAQSFVQSCVRATYGQEFAGQLEPSLAMRYRRITLVGKHAPEPVTIDFDLRFAAPNGTIVAAPPALSIVEVKSDDGRGRADAVFRRAGHRPERCSKYCVGLNLVRPGLRYNQFSRALVDHFGWSRPAALGLGVG